MTQIIYNCQHALAKQINNTIVALGQHGMDVTGPQLVKVRATYLCKIRMLPKQNADEAKRSAEDTHDVKMLNSQNVQMVCQKSL